MNLKTHYLTRNKTSGIYYIRLDIPPDLHQHFNIKTIKRSLRTHDRFQASIRCLNVISHFKSAFATLRGMPKFDLNNATGFITVKANGKEATFDTGDDEKDYEFGEKWMDKHGITDTAGLTASPKTNTRSSLPLSDVIEEYCQEQKLGGNWTDKSEGEFRSVYQLLLKIIGVDITTDLIDSTVARSYKTTLMKIPPHINKKQEYEGLSIPQIIAKKHAPISVKTINKQLTRVSSLMKWAKKEGYIAENYFSESTIKTKDNEADERIPFTTTDIGKIFSPKKPHDKIFHHWVPLLGYYTGARLNEICQLYVSDIRNEDGTWYFDINDDGDDKRLKNKPSKRRIPVHKSLKRLGFLDFVQDQKNKGLSRLFPELTLTRDGYGGNASKWFSRYLKKQDVIHMKKAFHSFRHTFVGELVKAKVHYKEIAGLVGHYDDHITTRRYGTGSLPIEILDEAIQKLPPHSDDI